MSYGRVGVVGAGEGGGLGVGVAGMDEVLVGSKDGSGRTYR